MQGHNITWLEYIQITTVLPERWFVAMEGKRRPPLHKIIPAKVYSIQEAKQFFLAKQYTPPAAEQKWKQPIHFNWEAQYKLARKMTIETKLQAFQFTILHHTVAHRHRLYFKRCVSSPY